MDAVLFHWKIALLALKIISKPAERSAAMPVYQESSIDFLNIYNAPYYDKCVPCTFQSNILRLRRSEQTTGKSLTAHFMMTILHPSKPRPDHVFGVRVKCITVLSLFTTNCNGFPLLCWTKDPIAGSPLKLESVMVPKRIIKSPNFKPDFSAGEPELTKSTFRNSFSSLPKKWLVQASAKRTSTMVFYLNQPTITQQYKNLT